METTRDPELAQFKREIDLRVFAADRGYTLDRKESWKGSSVLRHTNGDKVIVKKDHDGHYVYFSVRDERDNGSIIDFVQKRDGGTLGGVRKTLRPWIGRPAVNPVQFPALEKTSRDRMEVERQYRQMSDARRHPYLEEHRGLSPALLGSERFAGRIRMDGRGNAVFPHFDADGLCGYEVKNVGFTSFSRGGEKGLWFSRTERSDRRLVLAEGAIDTLSHAQLFPDAHTRYASIGGQMNPRQPGLIRAAIARMPEDSEIVAAMDADEEGRKLAAIVEEAVNANTSSSVRFVLDLPRSCKDWNDELRSVPSFPTAQIGL